MGRDEVAPVDLLEEIRAALDSVDSLLRGRVVDIEMARLRVVIDPAQFQRVFAKLVSAAVAQTEPPNSITVRVARSGKVARIEVENDGTRVGGDELDDLEDVTSDAEELRALGGDVGTSGPAGATTYWMSVPVVPGTSHAADG
jgi:light-regulated signal transduction histidine kinase (bacteriophytochrome)